MVLIRVNRKLSCPICEKNSSCSYDLQTNRYLCLRGGHAAAGFRLLNNKNGFYIYSKIGAKGQAYAGEVGKTKNRSEAGHFVKDEAVATAQPSMGELKYDISKVFKQLPLYDDHKSDLIKRGLTDEQIVGKYVSVDFKTVVDGCKGFAPGFNQKGEWLKGRGVLCPAFNTKGDIVGYQVKNDNVSYGKYLWCKAYEDKEKTVVRNTCKLKYKGEYINPLTSIKRDPQSTTWYLAEGLLKPHIIASRFKVNVIGAVGGNFTASSQLFDRILESQKPDRIVFAADSGTATNSSVLSRLEDIASHIKDNHNIELEVLDYGQLLAKAENNDPDEISSLEFNTANIVSYRFVKAELDPDEQLNAAYTILEDTLNEPDVRGDSIPLILHNILRKYSGRLHSPEFNDSLNTGIEFKSQDRTAILSSAYRRGYKAVLDVSGLGSGKSWHTGKLNIEDFAGGSESPSRLWYIHKQHRDPSTPTIEKGFAEYPTKNIALYEHPFKRTPALNLPVLMREGAKGARVHPGNCHRADEQAEYYKAGSTANLCKKCPFKADCSKGVEPGQYGYLFQVQEILKEEKIRANFNGINPNIIGENDIAIVDEYTQALAFTGQITVTLADWNLQENLLKTTLGTKFKVLKPVIDILSGKVNTGRFAWSYSEFKERFNSSPWAGLIGFAADCGRQQAERNRNAALDGSMPFLEWVEPFLQALSGLRADLTLTISNNGITIVSRNYDTLEKLEAFKMIVFMDATATPNLLATQLGCTPSDILMIKQEDLPVDNVTINQIASIGTPNKARTKIQRGKIEIVRDWAVKEYGADNVGFIDWKMYAKKGDLVHFVDGRGSNAFEEKKAVVSFGVANTNLGAARANYEVLTGTKIGEYSEDKSLHFSTYYRMLQQAEILQEIGRLRGGRRTEALDFYSVSDINLSFVTAMGYQYRLVRGYDISDDIMTPKEGIIKAALKLHELGKFDKVSVRKFCRGEGLSSSTLSRFLKSFKNGWLDFKLAVQQEVIDNPLVIYELIKRKCRNNRSNIISTLSMINQFREMSIENSIKGTVQDTVVSYLYSPYNVAANSLPEVDF